VRFGMEPRSISFVCGSNDELMSDNQTLYRLLQESGNQHLNFTTFAGGHDATLLNWQNMFQWVKGFSTERSVSVEGQNEQPTQCTLRNNYPNPFNPVTVIGYEIPSRIHVELKIFDVLGRELSTLVDREQDAGSHEVTYDGRMLSTGIYVYRLKAGYFIQSNKMLLLK